MKAQHAAILALLIASCSANSGSSTPYGGNAGSGASSGSGGAPEDSGTVLQDGSAGTGGAIPVNPEAGADVPLPDGDTCVGISVDAQPYPLDMYVMMDQSGSMGAPTNLMNPLGPTQWTAVKDAFVNFLNASPSTGLSMGIQYFPLPIVPWSTMPECSQSNPNCDPGELCAQNDVGTHCMTSCTTNANCVAESECMSFEDSEGNTFKVCSNDSCDVTRYATPEVEIGPIPGVNAQLLSSLNQHAPLTMTPTPPALKGAIDHAREWAIAHPDTTTIVVLATDGMPTACSSGSGLPINEVQQIAKAGVDGDPSILTFVIGVVVAGLPQTATALDSIAANGGTGQAFIINPAENMTQQFAAALEAIRGAFMECEFKIPDAAGMPDWNEVNVIYTAPDGTEATVYYVGSLAQCDPTLGGWYYDVDPAQGGTPSKITLCPQSCNFIQNIGGSIDIEVGCETIEPPK